MNAFSGSSRAAWIESFILLTGALAEIGFLAHAVGFPGTAHDIVGYFVDGAIILSPLVCFGTFVWALGLAGLRVMLLSLVAVIFSVIWLYQGYFPKPVEGAEWLFMMVPCLQFVFFAVIGIVEFILQKRTMRRRE